MSRALILKPKLLLNLAMALFVLLYILFSSLLTSLDFKLSAALEGRRVLEEQYEQAAVNLARLRDPEFLRSSSAQAQLVEETGATRYIDIRAASVGLAENQPAQP